MCLPLSWIKAGADATVKVTFPTRFLTRHTYSPSNPATKFGIERLSVEVMRLGSRSLINTPLWVNKGERLEFCAPHLSMIESPESKTPPRGWVVMIGKDDTSLMPWPSAERRERREEGGRDKKTMHKRIWYQRRRNTKKLLIYNNMKLNSSYITIIILTGIILP